MYVNNPSYGLKLIDFVEQFDNDNIEEDLQEFVYSFLKGCKKYFFIEDDVIFKNFCELFALNFYSRTINFDTTLELKLKIQNVLLYNKMKYQKLYEASLYTIKPLLTYSEEINTNESENGTNSNNNESHSTSEQTYNSLTDKTSYNNLKSTDSFNDYQEKSKTTTDYKKDYETTNKKLFSDTPQSNVDNVDNLFTNNRYVSNVQHDINGYKDKPNSQDINNTVNTFSGDKSTTQTGSVDNTRTGGLSNTGGSNSSGSGSFENSKSYNSLREGFNGNQSELLEKFVKIVFDVNKEIIDDMEKAHLFSNYYL